MVATASAERARRRVEGSVRRYMDAEDLWPADGRIMVAVSGGPDSTALQLVLSRLALRHPLQLTAAYFDHRLRGPEASAAELQAVEALASAAGVPLLTGAADVRGLAQRQKLSLEAAARQARYAFLADAAQQASCGAVATGHTASDQAETVLLHVLRGAGLAGLGGMGARAPWPFPGPSGLDLLRPLLALSRDQTLAYCRAAGVQPVEDESNRSTAFERNRLRHELLPTLRDFNPRVEQALVRLADAAREDAAYIDTLAAAAVEPAGPGELRLDRVSLRDLPAALRIASLRLALRRLAGDLQGFSQRHLDTLERLALAGRSGDSLDLARGVSARLTRESLLLTLGHPESKPLPDEAVSLIVPGKASFGPLLVTAGTSAPADATSVKVDAATLGDVICVRRRRNGDRFQPSGMSETKKLQDFFVDAHVPRAERDRVPLFETPRGIVWVGGLRLADWAQPRAGRPTVWLAYREA